MREVDNENDADDGYRLPHHKHRSQQHHQQITVSLGDEEDDEDTENNYHNKSSSRHDLADEAVDTSHVSIVTIDDNGKDVTIKTTSSTASSTHSHSRLDDLRTEVEGKKTGNRRRDCDYEEDYNENIGHSNAVDVNSSPGSSSSCHSRSKMVSEALDSHDPRASESKRGTNRHLNDALPSSDEVFVLPNSHDVAKEVIIVSQDSRNQSYNRQYCLEEHSNHGQQHVQNNRVRSEDQLSIQTESSESSLGQQDHIIMETRKKVPPAKNKDKKTAAIPVAVPSIPISKNEKKSKSRDDLLSNKKNGDKLKGVPVSSSSRTHSLSSFANGLKTGFMNSPLMSKRNVGSGNVAFLQREPSDAGSMASFASLNSDKDSNLAPSNPIALDGSTGVILRHRKVCVKSI